MNTENEKQSLQNFADKFNLLVKVFNPEDKRKKPTYYLVYGTASVSPKLDYISLNHFLLGWNACINYQH